MHLHARPYLDENTPQTCPRTGKEGRVVVSRGVLYRYHIIFDKKKTPTFKKQTAKEEGNKKANENKKQKGTLAACRVSNSRPQTQSCTRIIWTGRLFFLREKSIALHTAHARVTHSTRNAERPNLDDNVPQNLPCPRGMASHTSPNLWFKSLYRAFEVQ